MAEEGLNRYRVNWVGCREGQRQVKTVVLFFLWISIVVWGVQASAMPNGWWCEAKVFDAGCMRTIVKPGLLEMTYTGHCSAFCYPDFNDTARYYVAIGRDSITISPVPVPPPGN